MLCILYHRKPNWQIGFFQDTSTLRYYFYTTRLYPNVPGGNILTWNYRTYAVDSDYLPVLAILLTGNTPTPPAPDEPYGDDTYNQSVGGNGNHDIESDTISESALPIAAATRSGMVTAFVPDWGEIQDVADALLDPNIFQIDVPLPDTLEEDFLPPSKVPDL